MAEPRVSPTAARLITVVQWLIVLAILVFVILDIVGDGIQYTNLINLILVLVILGLGVIKGEGAVLYWWRRLHKESEQHRD